MNTEIEKAILEERERCARIIEDEIADDEDADPYSEGLSYYACRKMVRKICKLPETD